MNLGAFYIFLSTIFFTIMGVSVKYLVNIPSHEVVFFRSLIIFIICITTIKIQEKKRNTKINILGNDRKKLILRGLTGASGLAIYFYTIQKLPFAVAITLQYLSPVFTVIVSSLWLKEKGNKFQWVSLIISFLAVVLIQNITSIELSFYTYLGVLGALFSALSYTNVRMLSKTEHSLVIVFYFAFVTLIIGGPYTIYNFVFPNQNELLILLAMGISGHIGQYFLTRGYESDKASSVANFAYFNVVWSVLISEFILGEKLSFTNIIGISLIIFAAILSKLKFKRKKKIAMIFLAIFSLNTFALDKIVVSIHGEPTEGFDPLSGWGRYGSPLFQSTLLKRDHDLNIVKDLAKDFKLQNDRITWDITIRNDVYFSDGKKLTSDDVVYTYKTAKDWGGKLDLTAMKDIIKVDDYKVRIILKKPKITFTDTLATLGIVPKHYHSKKYSRHPIGSGPYLFSEWQEGQHLKVKINEKYYGKKPYFKEITFLFSSEESSLLLAKTGKLHLIAIPPVLSKTNISGMKLVSLPSVDNRGITFPMVREHYDEKLKKIIGNNVTSDLAIRKAINYGLNRQELIDGVLLGFGVKAYGPADGLPWQNKDATIIDNDINEASKILNNGGWKKNEDGFFYKDKQKATFNLIYPTDDKTREYLALTIREQLKKIGIDITISGMSYEVMKSHYHKDPVLFGWGGHSPLEVYHLYHSSMVGEDFLNVGFYQNKKIDKYLDQAENSNTFSESLKYFKLAEYDGEGGFSIKGDAPWAWLLNINHTYLVNTCLNLGKPLIEPHDHGWPLTSNIEEWTWNCDSL